MRNACSAFLMIDAQSVKNTDTAGLKGYDAGKKVSGIKRHIAVDTQVKLPLKLGVLSFVQNVDKELRNGDKASASGVHAGI